MRRAQHRPHEETSLFYLGCCEPRVVDGLRDVPGKRSIGAGWDLDKLNRDGLGNQSRRHFSGQLEQEPSSRRLGQVHRDRRHDEYPGSTRIAHSEVLQRSGLLQV